MTSGPAVTVALPVYNGERYLDETLHALRGQDLDDLEILVGDNASTDATEEIARSHAAADSRVLYVRSTENRGATWNYNRLVALASGRYFKWAAHDDLCRPDFVGSCVAALEREGPTVVLAYPRTILVGEHGEVLDDAFVDDLEIREPTPHERLFRYARRVGEQHAVFGVIRTEALRRTRLIAPFWGGDIPLLASLLLQGQFVEVERRAFLRRYHPGSSMVANATPSAVNAWFDPRRGGRPALPRTRLLGELLRVVGRSDLPAAERTRCAAAVVAGWLPPHARVMGGEVKALVRQQVAARRAGRGLGPT